MFLFCSCEAEGSNDAKDNDDAKENAKIVFFVCLQIDYWLQYMKCNVYYHVYKFKVLSIQIYIIILIMYRLECFNSCLVLKCACS